MTFSYNQSFLNRNRTKGTIYCRLGNCKETIQKFSSQCTFKQVPFYLLLNMEVSDYMKLSVYYTLYRQYFFPVQHRAELFIRLWILTTPL
jgi:hypothetical protein